jgi:hypothetical protein
MMMISMDKKYLTRNGREVRIYALDGGGLHTVQGAIKDPETGIWVLCRWNEQGRINFTEFPSDLFEVKPRIKRTVWVNVYANGFSGWGDRKTADANSSFTRLACVKVEIDCEEGHGL